MNEIVLCRQDISDKLFNLIINCNGDINIYQNELSKYFNRLALEAIKRGVGLCAGGTMKVTAIYDNGEKVYYDE